MAQSRWWNLLEIPFSTIRHLKRQIPFTAFDKFSCEEFAQNFKLDQWFYSIVLMLYENAIYSLSENEL